MSELAVVMACSSEGKSRAAVGPGERRTEGAPVDARITDRHYQASLAVMTASPGTLMTESVDDAEGLIVAVERCPLCNTARRRLTCARCIKAGDFVHFDGRNPERFVLYITIMFLNDFLINKTHFSDLV